MEYHSNYPLCLLLLALLPAYAHSYHENLALGMMVDYAESLNYTNCWICQNMPSGSQSPTLMPVPYNLGDWHSTNWANLATQFKDTSCYAPPATTYHDGGTGKQAAIIHMVRNYVNNRLLPPHFNHTRTHVVSYFTPQGKFSYRVQLALRQTTCPQRTNLNNCPFSSDTQSNSLICTVSIATPVARGWQITSATCLVRNCSTPAHSAPLKGRSPNVTLHVFPINDAPYCFNRTSLLGPDLGDTSCKGDPVPLSDPQPGPLPPGTYVVCNDKAYGRWPSVGSGVCYLAYLVPLIRKASSEEIRYLHMTRAKRNLSRFQSILGTIIPFYGVYNNQEELKALSLTLERHMNYSLASISALNHEIQEVKKVALQNRMALDLLLAAQGGVCSLIGDECCTYVSDASESVRLLKQDTAQGLTELHENHGWDLSYMFSGSTSGGIWAKLVSGLVSIFLAITVILAFYKTMECLCIKVTTIPSKPVTAQAIASGSNPQRRNIA